MIILPHLRIADAPTDPSSALLQHLIHAGSALIDRDGRKRLARELGVGADFQLELAIVDLHRRGLVRIEGDVLELASLRRAVAG